MRVSILSVATQIEEAAVLQQKEVANADLRTKTEEFRQQMAGARSANDRFRESRDIERA
jgi:hypothetical protein